MIIYYNGLDEVTENYPKGMPRPFKDTEKYYIQDEVSINNDDYTPDADNVIIDETRKALYVAEADPLFFMANAEETPDLTAWKAKREEIKTNNPKVS